MKLLNFTLEVDGEKIREISFVDGLNIITSSKKSGDSGNSVGKSTLGRILDYLFKGSISPIYIDEEFQTPKKEIEQLFKVKNVFASLKYRGLDSSTSVIGRRLTTDALLHEFTIDGQAVNEDAYVKHIMATFFNVTSPKPTLRKLAPKFLRTTHHRMTKTVNFDNSRNLSKSDLSTVFLYLFNFGDTEILTEIHKLKTVTKRYSRNLKAFKSVIAQDKIQSAITSLKKEIKKLEESLSDTGEGVDKLAIVSEINKLDDKQSVLSDQILDLKLKIKNVNNTNQMLQSGANSHLVSELAKIYRYAEVNVENSLKDYTKAIEFHERLLDTKKEFVNEEFDNLQQKLKTKEELYSRLSNDKSRLFDELKSKKKLKEVSDTIRGIGELNKELSSKLAIIDKRDEIALDLDAKQEELARLAEELKKKLSKVEEFEEKFINNFASLTSVFYGTEYRFGLQLDIDKGECNPKVDDVESNNEGGLKRLEVATFDLAYMKTVLDTKAARPSFVFHDSIDEIDISHIRQLFNESMKISGQQIVSMLSDKLQPEDYEKYRDNIILELSQINKFFKI